MTAANDARLMADDPGGDFGLTHDGNNRLDHQVQFAAGLNLAGTSTKGGGGGGCHVPCEGISVPCETMAFWGMKTIVGCCLRSILLPAAAGAFSTWGRKVYFPFFRLLLILIFPQAPAFPSLTSDPHVYERLSQLARHVRTSFVITQS